MCVSDLLALVCYDAGNHVYRLTEMHSKEYLKEHAEAHMSSEHPLPAVREA